MMDAPGTLFREIVSVLALSATKEAHMAIRKRTRTAVALRSVQGEVAVMSPSCLSSV
jgi:hypothetical protein